MEFLDHVHARACYNDRALPWNADKLEFLDVLEFLNVRTLRTCIYVRKDIILNTWFYGLFVRIQFITSMYEIT